MPKYTYCILYLEVPLLQFFYFFKIPQKMEHITLKIYFGFVAFLVLGALAAAVPDIVIDSWCISQ